MATKMKGIIKGFKFISQFFVYREHEIEIGHPTDVKHVSHVGWHGSSANAPSWMNDYKTSSDFSSTSLNRLNLSKDTNPVAVASWSSQDCPPEVPRVPKKTKRKKSKAASPSSPSRSSRRSSKSKGSFAFDEAEGMSGPLDVRP